MINLIFNMLAEFAHQCVTFGSTFGAEGESAPKWKRSFI